MTNVVNLAEERQRIARRDAYLRIHETSIVACRKIMFVDPVAFAEFFGIELDPWQKTILECAAMLPIDYVKPPR